MVKSRDISFEDLEEYSGYHRSDDNEPKSLNEFIQDKYNLDSNVRAKLSKITFDKDHRIDLTNANLSNVILDDVDFNGEHVVLKGADLRGSSTKNTKFTNYINLEGVNFGNIILDRNKFSLCQLKGAIYKPFEPENKKIEVQVTDRMLKEFLKEKEKNVNLSQFISDKLGLKKDSVIADLSDHIIDSKFSNVDISGSNISDCIIKGDIENLKMRDCKISETLFESLTMKNSDLRGTNLASYLGENRNKGAIFSKNVVFLGGNFSLPKEKAKDLVEKSFGTLTISESVRFDPNYNKDSDIENEYVKCDRSQFKAYAEYCLTTKQEEIKTISQFLDLKANQVADFSNEDLSKIELINGKIDRCNFSFCKFAGSKFSETEFKNCNLVNSSFVEYPAKYLFFTGEPIKSNLNRVSFVDCDLTAADLREAKAPGINLINSTAINLKADAIDIEKGKIENSDLSGSSWEKATVNLNSKYSNWSFANCYKTNFQGAGLEKNEFCSINAQEAIFTGTKLSFSDLAHGNFSFTHAENANLDNAKLQSANFEGAKISGTTLNDADISALIGTLKKDKEVDFATAISCEEQIRYAKEQKEAQIKDNKEKIYKEYCKNIVFAIVVIAISLPLVIPVILPVTVAAVVMPIIFTPLVITSTIAVVASGIDYLDSKIGYNLFSQ